MYRYKKIMVCLNLDDHDQNLIAYAGILSKMAASDEIHFVYVSDTFDLPPEIKKIYPELASPAEAAAEERLASIANQHFNGHAASKLIFRALEGPALGLMINYTKKEEIDLLIVSHDRGKKAAGNSFSEKLARKAFCSVLIVPDQPKVRLEKIVVAVDFSDYSLNAMDVGTAFAKAAGLDTVYLLNTYHVPSGYYKTGKSYEEFDSIMQENAKSKLRLSLSKVDMKSVRIQPFFKETKDVVAGIHGFARNLDADLIVVGARGRSGDIAAILLGSITEGLIRKLERPLLAVKRKGEGLNILDAITSE